MTLARNHNAQRPGAQAAPVAAGGVEDGMVSAGRRVAIFLFVLLALLPFQPLLAGINLMPYRVYLLAAFIPLTIILAREPGRGLHAGDALMAALSAWVVLTLVYHHGARRFEYAVMSSIEFYGAYIVGRALINNYAAFRSFLNIYFVGLLFLLPFAIYENRTGTNLLLDFFGQIGRTNAAGSPDLRSGGFRAQSVFAHPIHFGIAGSLFLGCFYYVFGWGKGRFSRVTVAAGIVFCAQSSAPILAATGQAGIILWGAVTRNKWKVLIGLSAILYIFLSLASNRGPIILVIETLTLNPRTAWWRVHVWNYGIQNVWANPLLGLGLKNWVRPSWLASTVDNFWLVVAMRHGIPAFLCLAVAVVINVWRIIRTAPSTENQTRARLGYMVSFCGLVMAFSTVFAWGQMVAFFMFFLGAGSFLYNRPTGRQRPAGAEPETAAPEPGRARLRFTRFGATEGG